VTSGKERKMTSTFDELGQRLKAERKHLIKELEQVEAGAPAVGEMKEGSPYGKKEEGAAEAFELEKRLALKSRLTELLGNVEHALTKIKQGNYDTCDACGQSIDVARLDAFPQASLCLSCKAGQGKNAKVKLPPR